MKTIITLLLVLMISSCSSTYRVEYCSSKTFENHLFDLMEQGYSKDWATHKAIVECGYIPSDCKYEMIEED